MNMNLVGRRQSSSSHDGGHSSDYTQLGMQLEVTNGSLGEIKKSIEELKGLPGAVERLSDKITAVQRDHDDTSKSLNDTNQRVTLHATRLDKMDGGLGLIKLVSGAIIGGLFTLWITLNGDLKDTARTADTNKQSIDVLQKAEDGLSKDVDELQRQMFRQSVPMPTYSTEAGK